MSAARYHLLKAINEKDSHDRFRIYSPTTERSQDIYVHAKVMIVDDMFLRVGSANINNRSMGLDSECDLLIDGRDDSRVQSRIREIRCDLLAEHLGVAPAEFARAFKKAGGLIQAIESLRGSGRTLWPLEPRRPGTMRSKVGTSEALDPEAAGEMFEPSRRPGLLGRLRRRTAADA